MKNRAFLLIFFAILISGCSTGRNDTFVSANNAQHNVGDFVPITIYGERSDVSLAYARRQNYFNQFGMNDVYPDGLVFYFVSRPSRNNNLGQPIISEVRDFRVNGKSYREMTRADGIDDIEPASLFYDDEQSFQWQDEHSQEINIKWNNEIFIMKTVIFGTTIPDHATIDVDLQFLVTKKKEEFHFQFTID